MRIRDARADEAAVLEALQRRSSDIWEEYREQLAAHPDAIEVPQSFIENGWTRVAVADDRVIGTAQTRFAPAVRLRRDL